MADQGAIGFNRSDIGIRPDAGWPTATAGFNRSDIGIRPDAGWPTATATVSALSDYRYLVPGWGWWSVPVPLTVPVPLLRQLPATWHTSTGAFSVQHPRATLGVGSLSGSVIVSGLPASRRVFVMDRNTLEIAGGVTSGADGSWSVSGLVVGRKYLAVCRFDPDENAVIYDLLDPA